MCGGKTNAPASKTGNEMAISTEPQIGIGLRSAIATTSSQPATLGRRCRVSAHEEEKAQPRKRRMGVTPPNSRIRSSRGSLGVRGRRGSSRVETAVLADIAPPSDALANPMETSLARATVTKLGGEGSTIAA